MGRSTSTLRLWIFSAVHTIPVHFFSYYGYYRGSFYPTEYLLAGEVLIAQVKHYLDSGKRLFIAREILLAATHNIVRNLAYYNARGVDLQQRIDEIEVLRNSFRLLKRFLSSWQQKATSGTCTMVLSIA